MSRILIVGYGSLGDLHPVIALARGLQARGHEAVIASSAPYRAKVTALGLPFEAIRPDLSLSDEALVRRVMDGTRGSAFLMRELVYPAVRGMYEDLLPLAMNADLVIGGELACALPILGEKHHRPWAYFALSPVSFLPVYDPSVLPGPSLLHRVQSLGPAANRFIHFLARRVSRGWWRPVRALRAELGLREGASPLFSGKYSPTLNLALFSRVLQPPQPDWPVQTKQTGFLFHDDDDASAPLPTQVQQFLDAGPPPIVFTLGSAAVHLARDFYTHSAAAAKSLGCRALLLLGNNPPPPDLPGSILGWPYLPFSRVFPRSAAIVHQGGIGTTAQAMRAGRPMVVIPFAHDQFDNAARVTRLGVGLTLAREKYNPDSAARVLDRLLARPEIADASRAVGEKIRAENGLAEACGAIERALSSGPCSTCVR